jgi:hypothetical protein
MKLEFEHVVLNIGAQKIIIERKSEEQTVIATILENKIYEQTTIVESMTVQ